MNELDVVTSADRRDLSEQVTAAFRPLWPEFIFHDPVDAEYSERVESYFSQYDVMLLDAGEVVTGGWGVPLRWNGTLSDLPDGYDEALQRAVTGHERSAHADTLCIMAAAVRLAGRGAGSPERLCPRFANEPRRPVSCASSHRCGPHSRAGTR